MREELKIEEQSLRLLGDKCIFEIFLEKNYFLASLILAFLPVRFRK